MDSTERTLLAILKNMDMTLSTAESCTGGLLASSITSISGASKIFNLGLVTYSNQSKIKFLKVNKNIIKKYGAVSVENCKSMVINLSKISKANINVSITGIAGPKGGSKNKPVGLVYIGVKKDNKVIINKNIFNYRSRISVQKAATKKTLKIILDLIK